MQNLTRGQLIELNEYGEADAWKDFFMHAPDEFKNSLHLSFTVTGSSLVTMIPGLNWTFFNRINGLGVRSPASEKDLDEALSILEKAGVTNFMAQVPADASPAQLPQWLKARGFTEGSNWAKVCRGDEPAPVPVTDLEISAIDEKQAAEFVDVALAAFEMPEILRPLLTCVIGQEGWYHYLGYDDGQAVSSAAMYVQGETAWLGFGSTLEAYRGRGWQSAMFARRISNGLDLNCKWFVTETGEDTLENPNPSYHNMLKAGFCKIRSMSHSDSGVCRTLIPEHAAQ